MGLDLRRSRRHRGLLLAGLLWGLFVGPWPAHPGLPQSPSMQPIVGTARPHLSPGNDPPGPLRIGLATVDLVPSHPIPLAGYIGGVSTPFSSVNSPCVARALTVSGPSASVTILAADLLLIDARLARSILERTGLARDQIYFTATHTHGGPGGWGVHPLERLVAGTYDPAAFERLTDRLAAVVVRSRARLVPVDVAFVQISAPGRQWNRLTAGGITNEMLSAWVFRASAPAGQSPDGQSILAMLTSFGAHATVAHPNPPPLGADYPGAFTAELARLAAADVVLFAAGTVGDAGPIRPSGPNEQSKAEAYGRDLARHLAPSIRHARFRTEISMASIGREVELPAVQLPFRSASLRFSPLATWWVGRPKAYLHAVRLGPAVLIGFPGDYAGELARTIHAELPVVATSFSGEYKGYLMSAATFRAHACYETRWMSFFGAHLGDHLTKLATDLIADVCRGVSYRP